MDNQQVNIGNILLANISPDFKLKSKSDIDTKKFILDVDKDYDFLINKYNITYYQAKRLKQQIYKEYDKTLPNGFVHIAKSPFHAINANGVVINAHTRHTVNATSNGFGYLQFCGPNKVSIKVHRLVAETFVPNPNNKPQVNHIDGNKQNNNADNLEWVNNSENIQHAFDNNLIDRKKIVKNMTGSRNHQAKLTERDVAEIKALCSNNTNKEIAMLYPVHPSLIGQIHHGKVWKHVNPND